MDIPGIYKIEVLDLDNPSGTLEDCEKYGEAKLSIKKERKGLQTLYNIELTFFSKKNINTLSNYQILVTTFNKEQYRLGGSGLPLPQITSEYKDGQAKDGKGYSYKVKLVTHIAPI